MDKVATWGLTLLRKLHRIWIRLNRNRDYGRWQAHFEPDGEEWNRQRSLALDLENPKSFTLRISVAENELNALRMTLAHLQSQSYPFWHLRIHTRMCSIRSIRELLDVEQEPDSRISIASKQPNTAEAHTAHLGRNEGYVVCLRPGDCLANTALWEVMRFLEEHPEIDLVYADEDQLDKHSGRHTPWFKPDWSPELLYSVNYLQPLFIRRHILREDSGPGLHGDGEVEWAALWESCITGGFRVGHIPKILLHRMNAGQSGSAGSAACELDLHTRWVERRFHQLGKKSVRVTPSARLGLRVTWETKVPPVSIIIPTRGNPRTLGRCLQSLTEKTAYPAYEILVLDSSKTGSTQAIIAEQVPAGVPIKRIPLQSPFRYSEANNEGARAAAGELFLFLNDDVEIVEADWLEELVRWAELPEIGAVGATLLYPNGTIQHAGVILGLSGHANHIFRGVEESETGPYGSTGWYRNFLAITGACMMLRREVFDLAGGFDEDYELAFSDIELCLRILKDGLRVMVTPYASLIHREGSSRGRTMPVEDILLARDAFLPWVRSGDPYFNPNLSYASTYPRVAAEKQDRVARLDRIVKRAQGAKS